MTISNHIEASLFDGRVIVRIRPACPGMRSDGQKIQNALHKMKASEIEQDELYESMINSYGYVAARLSDATFNWKEDDAPALRFFEHFYTQVKKNPIKAFDLRLELHDDIWDALVDAILTPLFDIPIEQKPAAALSDTERAEALDPKATPPEDEPSGQRAS
jgi:hypothetical protein